MSTQLFISWSGDLSHKVASLIHEWIPTVLQSAEPFLSSTDIEKGSRWSDHVAQKLEECGFGIIVLTKANLLAPWILFEAGALSKMVGRTQVSALSIGIDLVDVKLPLSQFQNTKFDKDDVLKLVHSINRSGPNPLRDDVLARSFNALWPDLEKSVSQAVNDSAGGDAKQEVNRDDNSSLKSSIGELIQSVQSLRDDVKRSSVGIDQGDLMREIRMSVRKRRSLPPGLLDDINTVVTDLDNSRDILGDPSAIEDGLMEKMIVRLKRAARFLEREIDLRSVYDDRNPVVARVLVKDRPNDQSEAA